MWEPRRPVTARGRQLVDNCAVRTRYGAEASGRGSRLQGVEGQHRHRGERLVRHVVGRAKPVPSRTVGDAVLHLHRAERADTLAAALGDLITEPPADPFTAEVVAVPARGMERWLAHRLAHRLGTASGRGDGVCALVAFPAPGEVVATAVEGATGMVRPTTIPGTPPGAVWPLLEVVDTCAGRPWCAPLAAHLERARSRFAVVAHVTGAVRRLRQPAARACSTPGAPGDDAERCPRTCAGSRSCGGACATRIGGRTRPSGWPTAIAVLRARPRRAAPCRSGCRCSAPPACPRDQLAVLAALAARTRRAPVAAASLARAVGPASRRWPRACPRAAPTRPPTLAAPSAARLARPGRPGAAAAAGGPCRASTTHHLGGRPRAGDAAAAAAARRAATTGRPTGRPRARRRRPQRRRCTPATARPARSRCSARCCSACSPTTRPWSRATCWSCARTSRRSRR